MKLKTTLLACIATVLCAVGFAQQTATKNMVEISLTPDHADWNYKTGEKVKLTVTAEKAGMALADATIAFEYGPEMMPAVKKGEVTLKNGVAVIEMEGMKQPGFQTCNASVTVDGKRYNNWVTVGFDPYSIKPTTTLPADFNAFWDGEKARWAKQPLKAKMTLMPERCTDKVDVYHISYDYNGGGAARFYGILAMPKAPGKYPAIYYVPGAGVRPYYGSIYPAEQGFITLQIGIHGIPVDMPAQVYEELKYGALSGYPTFNNDDKSQAYYKKVYEGCVRGVEFIYGLEKFDGKRLALNGGSQGGALSVIVSSLDPRVSCLVSMYPALSDMTGYLYGRAGGWPHQFRNPNPKTNATPDKVETSKYYDVVNFARGLKVPAFFTWGYNDKTCPPTSTFSVYNVVTSPKELMLAPNTAHWTYGEQGENGMQFIKKQFGMQ